MDEGHTRTAVEVETFGQRGWAEHGDYGHAVHVVGDGFTIVDAEAAPAFAFVRFEAFDCVKEGKGGGSVGFGARDEG